MIFNLIIFDEWVKQYQTSHSELQILFRTAQALLIVFKRHFQLLFRLSAAVPALSSWVVADMEVIFLTAFVNFNLICWMVSFLMFDPTTIGAKLLEALPARYLKLFFFLFLGAVFHIN